jgi:hypothetical protein
LGSEDFSSCTSTFSSSKSLRMMILLSLGGPRKPWLCLPYNHWVNSKSREVSTIKSSSSKDEDRSITGAFSEGPPCSNTGERGRCETTSDRDPGGDGDPDRADRGVLESLGAGLPSVEGERSRLMSLLSSIVGK